KSAAPPKSGPLNGDWAPPTRTGPWPASSRRPPDGRPVRVLRSDGRGPSPYGSAFVGGRGGSDPAGGGLRLHAPSGPDPWPHAADRQADAPAGGGCPQSRGP